MSLGSRLKDARLNKKLTQPELAAIIGISKGAIGNYETEVSSPNEDILIKLMKCLEVDANFLYQDYLVDDKSNFYLSSDEKHLVTTYRSLTTYGKQLMQDRAAELIQLYGEKPSEADSEKSG